MFIHLLLPLAASLAPLDDPPLPAPDTIVAGARDKTYEGRIVNVNADQIVLLQKSRLKVFEREEVKDYNWVDESLALVLDELSRGAAGELGVADLHALAQRCAEINLPGEAQLAHWMVLAQDLDNVASHEALGHRKSGKRWRARVGTRWVRDDKLEEACSDFGDAWEFYSAHFDLRTNLSLDEALRIIVDAERIYHAYFVVFGDTLALYRPAERMGLHMHADEKSFPGGGDRRAMYLSADRRSVIDASTGYDPSILARWLNYQLLDAVGRQMGDRAALPRWVTEGLSRLFEATLGLADADAREIDFDPKRRHDRLRGLHARARDPEKLNRVLQYGPGDFYGGDRELRWAQSYTLVEFLLEGEEHAHSDAFRAFILGAFAGKGSSTHFKKAIGLKEKDLEERWNAYVGRND